MYTCGIVEDEYLARKLLLSYVERFPNLEAHWAIEAITNPNELPLVDILFLDLLDMPSTSAMIISEGIKEFVSDFPVVVITTAYAKGYAGSIGIAHKSILTKPYTYEEFARVVKYCLAKS